MNNSKTLPMSQVQLSQKHQDQILDHLHKFSVIDEAVIFGSRGMGNSQPASDVDLAIKGSGVSFETVSRLHYLLEEETDIPLFFDVVDYNSIDKPELKEHIDRVGVKIYSKG